MALLIHGFADRDLLEEHFDKHVIDRNEFPHLINEEEYEEAAKEFLSKPLDASRCHEGQRQNLDGSCGDLIRYDKITQEFAVMSNAGFILTYYIADPNRHNSATNYKYFLAECKKVKG